MAWSDMRLMGKKRETNKHLPRRVYFKNGAYYHVDKKNKWHYLAKPYYEAMAIWAKKFAAPGKISTMSDLMNRYMVEVAPLKSKASYEANLFQIKPLKSVFGEMEPGSITPVHVYAYMDRRAKSSKFSANREKELLSHIFTMAIRWGVVDKNPCRDVRKFSLKPRERYITDEELEAVKSIASPFMKGAIDFAYLTGLRRTDILNLKASALTEQGIKIETQKTGAKMIIKWSTSLRECVKASQALRAHTKSDYIFCNEDGLVYTKSGFSTLWTRLIKSALKKGLIKETFMFRDIRAKTATDSKNTQTASELLGHTSKKTTEKHYIRKYKEVDPLK